METLGEDDLLVFRGLFHMWRKVRANRGQSVGEVEHAEWNYSSGNNLSLGRIVDAWRVQRAKLINAPSFGTFDCLGKLADAGSYLLRKRKGRVKLLTSAVGPHTLAPHVDERQVEHWRGKVQKMRRLLAEWPQPWTRAWQKQASQLMGLLLHVSFAVRPRKKFVSRFLADVGMPQSATESRGLPIGRGRRVVLGPEFHGDLEFWRWFANEGFDAIGGCLSAPMHNWVLRPARRTLLSDAYKRAIGGYCLEKGVHWRYNLTKDEHARSCESSLAVVDVNDIY